MSVISQEQFIEFILGLGIGETLTIPPEVSGTQWAIELKRTDALRVDVTIYNPVGDGGRKLYQVTTLGNPWGAPTIIQEPTLGIPCRDAGIDSDGNLVGVVVLNEENAVILRASWSKLAFAPKPEDRVSYSVSPGGEVVIGDKSMGYIHAICLPDKNRMAGWVAFVRPNQPDGPVKKLELEDLVVAALAK